MCTNITIRSYQETDWACIEEIHDSARKMELESAQLSDAFVPLKQAAQSEGLFEYTLRVAEQEGKVVGFVAYTSDELAWLYVHPDCMRKGVGRALTEHVLKNTERPLCIEVLMGNERACAFYQAMGFALVKTLSGKMPGNEAFDVSVYVMELA